MRIFAFEVENGIDEMFQSFRPGDKSFFGDVADEHDRAASRLGSFEQAYGACLDLRHAAGFAFDRTIRHRLDRINHGELRFGRLNGGHDRLDVGFGEYLELRRREAEPVIAEFELFLRFFAGHVQHLAACRDSSRNLEDESGFADPGIAAEQ